MLVPVVVAMIATQAWLVAFGLFVLAGVSDGVDGFIAKHYDLRSELGAYLDPLADKALLVSIYITLAVEAVLPGWMAILVVSRDLMIVGGVIVSWVLEQRVEIKPLPISKLNTVAQIVLAATVLGAKAFGLSLDPWLDIMIGVAATLTLASMAAYLAQWLRHMSG